MSDAIAEAIREHWGEKCGEFEPECPTCQVWAEFAELSRLSALVAEWQKAAEPFADWYVSYDRAARILHPDGMPDSFEVTPKFHFGNFRRLSQLKDTTNADK